MRKRALILVCLFIIPFFLTACFDAHEIGEFTYATMIGFEHGVSDKYRITFQILKFVQSSGGENKGGGQETTETITFDVPTLAAAFNISNTNISKILNFMHIKAIVISEELATSGHLGESITPLMRYRQIRRTTNVIVCKGKAEEFIKATKPYAGELVTKTLEDLVENSKNTGYFPKSTFNDFYDGIKAPYHALMLMYGAINKGENLQENGLKYEGKTKDSGDYYAGDVPRSGGGGIELFGSAILNGDKMVGKLTGFETQLLLMMRGELKSVSFTIPDPEIPTLSIPLSINEFEKPKIDIDLNGGSPKIHAKLKMEGDILTIQSRIHYEDPEKKKIVEDAFEKYIVEGVERVFAKCKVFKADVFNFGTEAVTQFWTIPEWENYNWLEKFDKSELKVEADFTIRRTGKIIKSEPIYSSEGKE